MVNYLGEVLCLREGDFLLLLLVGVLLLVVTAIGLFFETRGYLDAFEEANAEPDILGAPMLLERQSQVTAILVLPRNNGVTLPLEITLARNETAVQDLVNVLLVA